MVMNVAHCLAAIINAIRSSSAHLTYTECLIAEQREREGGRYKVGVRQPNVCSTITLRFLHNQRHRHRHNNQPK